MNVKTMLNKLAGIGIVCASLLFVSCPNEVGLGAAVDTQRPTVSIDSPAADSVVRKSVTITGKASDEVALSTVTVTFRSTERASSEAVVRTFPAIVDVDKGTWSLSINTEDQLNGLVDSRYIVTATATDKSGKTAEEPRSYQVDNTAPTVLITSPTLYGTNTTKYCQQIEIKGEAYDASTLQSVTVYICDKDGNVLAQTEADGTNTWSAVFRKNAVENILNDTDTYYFYAIAEDAAGNTNQTFYHKADIFGLPNVDAGFPSMNEIGRLDQGIYTTTPMGVSAYDLIPTRIKADGAAIRAEVQKAAAAGTSEIDYPGFSYQKDASAKVRWTNLGNEKKAGSDDYELESIGKDTPVYATIMPPTDNSAVLTDTILVEMWKTDQPADKWSLNDEHFDSEVSFVAVGDSINCTINTKDRQHTSLSAGLFTVKITFRTNSGKEITDQHDFQITSEAPVILEEVITGAGGQNPGLSSQTQHARGVFSTKETAGYTLRGKLQQYDSNSALEDAGASASMLEGTDPLSTCKNSSGNAVPITVTYNSTTSEWEIAFANSTVPDDTYTFTIKAKNGSATSSITREYVLDTTKPELAVISPEDGKFYRNSEIVLQGSASDDGSYVKTSYWMIADGDVADPFAGTTVQAALAAAAASPAAGSAPVNGTWYRFSAPTSFSVSGLDFSSYAQKSYKVFMIAEDNAGLISALSTRSFSIDNGTPVLETAWPAADALVRKTASGLSFSGKAYDGSGILKSVSVILDDVTLTPACKTWAAPDASDPANQNGTYDGTTESRKAVWSYTPPADLAEGTHTIQFVLTDNAGRTSSSVIQKIVIDKQNPELSFANIIEDDEGTLLHEGTTITSNSFEAKGTVSDNLSGVKEVRAYRIEGGNRLPLTVNGTSAWSMPLTGFTTEGEVVLCFEAEDNAGNILSLKDGSGAEKKFYLIVDREAPRAEINTYLYNGSVAASTESYTGLNTYRSLVFKGKADDAAVTAGRQAASAVLTYSKDNGSSTEVTGFNWDQAAGTWNWTMKVGGADGLADGLYDFTLTVTDAIGKVSTARKSVRIDTEAPIVTVNAPSDGGIYSHSEIVIQGTASDYGSFVGTTYWKITTDTSYAPDFSAGDTTGELAAASAAPASGTKPATDTWYKFTGTTSFSATGLDFSEFAEKQYKLVIVAADNAGNCSTAVTRQFYIDNNAPVLTETWPAAADLKRQSSSGLTVSGTAYDGSGILKSVTLIYDGVTAASPLKTWPAPDASDASNLNGTYLAAGSAASWSWSAPSDWTSGSHTVQFLLTDNAGRTSLGQKKTVMIDAQAPELTVMNVTDNEVIAASTLTVKGTASDSLSGIASVKAYKVSGETETALTVTGTTAWNAALTADDLAAEGILKLKFVAVDNCGNESSPVVYSLRIDKKPPRATIKAYAFVTDAAHSTEEYSGTTTSSTLVLKGIADDAAATANQQAVSAKLSYTKDGGSSTDASGFSWTKASGEWNWTMKVGGAGGLADGSYVFSLLVVDEADRETTVTYSILIDTTAPAISAPSFLNDGKVWLDESASNTLTVAVSDDGAGASGIAGVWYKVTAENEAVPAFTSATESSWTRLAQGLTNWSTIIDFSTPKTDEKLKVYIAAKDNAGNRAVYSENGSVKPVTVIKDKMAPELSIQSCPDFTGGSDITMTLRVKDTNPTAPTVKVADASDTERTISVSGPTDVEGCKEYTAVIPFSTQASWFKQAGQYKSGQYTVTVTEADANGRAATPVTQKITLDATAPEVALTSHAAASFQNSGNLVVTGTVTEAHLEAIKAQVWSSGAQVGSDEDITDYTKNGDTYTFTWRKYDLADGTYTVKIVASDKGGLSASAETAAVTVDKTAPAVTMAAAMNGTFLKRTDNSSVAAISDGGSYMTGKQFTLSGAITEANLQSATLSITKDGLAQTPVTFGAAATSWTYTQAAGQDHSADGNYDYKLTVIDKAGNRTEKTVTVLVDTTGPSVSITHPAADESSSTAAYSMSGTFNETGSGIKAIYYTLDGSAPTTASPKADLSGKTWSKAISLGATQGSLTLKIMAEDVLGNKTDSSVVFYYDTDNPVLTETAVGTNGTTTSSSFTFSGTASDTNALFGKQADGTATGAVTITTGSGASASTRTVNVASDGSWSAAFNAGTGTDAAGNPRISDGNHVFTITVKDVAGKTTSVTRTVRVDTTAPVITETTFPAGHIYLDDGVYARLTTKAADSAGTDPTGLAGVYYKLVTGATVPAFTAADEGSWTAMAQGASSWTANIDFTGNTDGTVYVYVAAKDLAGNRTVPTAASACRATMSVDVIKPVLSVQSGATFTGADAEALTVRVTDTNPTAPTVSVTGAATSNATVSAGPTATAADGSWKEWKVTVPMTADGTYTVTINEADGNSRAAVPVTHSIERDTQNPTVSFTTYTTEDSGYKTDAIYQKTTGLTLRGSATDEHMESVTVQLYAKNSEGNYIAVGTSEDITDKRDEDGSFTWDTYNRADGTYKIKVTALDKAAHSVSLETEPVIIDVVSPESDIDQVIPGMMGPDTVYQMVDGASFSTAETCSLSGIILDPYYESAVMTITRNGTAVAGSPYTLEDNYPATAEKPYIFGYDPDQGRGEWLWDINAATDHSDDGTYVYTLTVVDKSGNQTVHKVTAMVDTTSPVLAMTQPASGEYLQAATAVLGGTVADTGVGVASVTYTLTRNGTVIGSADTAATVTGASWTSGEIALGGEGTLVATIKASDTLGNTTEATSTVFYYDQSVPSLEETEIGSSGKTTNAAFTFSGTASDTNALYAVDGTEGKGAITITAGSGDSAVSRAVNVDVANGGAWSTTFTPGSSSGNLADGTYVFTITARDVAGRTKAIQRTVIVDTQEPIIAKTGSNTGFVTSSASNGWYGVSSLALSATVTDERAGGVETVEYAVSQTESTDWTGDSIVWHALTKNGSTYTGNAEVEDGTDYICIRARDTAGNVTYADEETVKVDTTAPSVAGVFKEQACTNDVNTVLTNAGAALTVYVKTEDLDLNDTDGTLFGSGTASVRVKIGSKLFTSGTITATKVSSELFSVTLTQAALAAARGASDKNTVVYAQLTDGSGISSTPAPLFTLQYDMTPPTVTFTSPAGGATVNKTIPVTGKTVEAQELKSVTLYANNEPIQTFTGGAMYSWSYDLDTTAYEPESPATTSSIALKIAAEDEAGNTAEEQITITADQATDRPEIKLSNVAFDGMASNNPMKLLRQGTIYGSINDDDGRVKTLKYALKQDGVELKESDWISITQNNGSFSLDLEDDTHTIYFKVVDADDGTFTTADSDSLLQPVIKGQDEETAADGIIYLTVDTQNPDAENPQFSLDGSDWTFVLSSMTFANEATDSFQIRQYAYDANSIAKVEVSVDSGSFAEATEDSTAPERKDGTRVYQAFKYTYTLPTDTPLASGTHTLHIRVTDGVGSTTEKSATFSVDNSAPTVSVTSHADGDRVKGSFFIAGTTLDAPLSVGATSLLYKVTASETLSNSEDWTATTTDKTGWSAHEVTGSLSSWRVYFDDDVNASDFTHDRVLKKVLVTIPDYNYLEIATAGDHPGAVVYKEAHGGHAKGTLYTDITTLYVHFKATDAYGNASYFVRSLSLDPQGDIPTVEIAYPTVGAYGWKNGSTVIYTEDILPVVGDSAYATLDKVATKADPMAITAINRTAHTITVGATTYTCFGGETVQGGIVRIQGSAEDEKAIAAVYIQIDPTYDRAAGFQWTEGSAGNALLPDGTTKLSDKYNIEPITTGLTGIKVGENVAWSYSLNRSGEFNGQGEQRNYIGIRAFAKDTDGNVSPLNVASDIIITIDSDTPRIGASEELYLYQYANNDAGTGSVVASQKYEDNMWLNGKWWLKGSVEDSNGINSITVDGNDVIAAGKAESQKWNEGEDSETSGYVLKYQIGSDAADEFGTLSYVIYALDKDTNAKSVTKTISVNYDNKAPVLAAPDSSNYNISHSVVQNNGFYTLGSAVTELSSETASQSGFDRLALYFVRPGATLAQSSLYDTYILKSGTGNSIALNTLTYADGLYWKTATVTRSTASLSTITLPAADANIHAGGLVKIGGAIYVIRSVSDKTVIINGSPVIKNNQATDGDGNAIADYLKEEASFAMAIIVDHSLVESNGINLGTNGYYTDVINDDGDNIVEKVTSQGATSFWEANINSRNIPDGSVEIHYVAFDKAGNYAVGVVACQTEAAYNTLYAGKESTSRITYDYDENNLARVANNAPRLAGVRYGTDDNGNGSVSNDELKSYLFAVTTSGGAYTASSLRTSCRVPETGTDAALKIKGATRIIPEIVGGNNALSYSYTVTKSGESSPYFTKDTTAFTDGSGNAINGTDYSFGRGTDGRGAGLAAEVITSAEINMSVVDLLSPSNGATLTDGAGQTFKFTISDSTPGGSQYSELEMIVDINLLDSTPPTPFVRPFYWNGYLDNSIYRTTVGANTYRHGHIDLGADLPHATGDAFSSSNTGLYDLDDKVSGTVVIEGTATDNVLLSGIYMKLFTESGSTVTDVFSFQTGVDAATSAAVTAATAAFKRTAASASADFTCYQVASFSGGTWSVNDYLADYGWKFSIVGDDTFDQNGHTVSWKLELDTEKLNPVAAPDIKLAVMATDKGSPSLGQNNTVTYASNSSVLATTKTSGDDATTQTNYNRFDVVPYVVDIKTSLSSAKKTNPSLYNRTALGHYPVASSETVVLAGFNLAGAKYGATALTSLTAAEKTALPAYYTNAATSFVKLGVSNVSASGAVEITSGTGAALVKTLNNINDDDAKGTSTDAAGTAITLDESNYSAYAYNRKPNGDNNQKLTDDIILDVWTINSNAAVARDGGIIEEPVMKINPNNGSIGFAFASGADSFCMPNGTSSTYTWWSTNYANFSNIALDYDDAGNAFAIAVGLDTNSGDGGYGGRMALMTSLWGRGSNYSNDYDNFHVSNKLRIESIGLPSKAYAFGTQKTDYQLDTKRFKSTSLNVTTHGTTRAVYLAYYDRMTGQIRFRAGSTTATTKDGRNNGLGTYNSTNARYFGQFIDAYGISNGSTTAGYVGGSTANTWSEHRCFESIPAAYSLIAGAESQTPAITTGLTAGSYVALDVVAGDSVNNDKVVIVFYDGTDLYYVYRMGDKTVDANVSKDAATTYWSKPEVVFEGIGRDATIKVGPDGSIHIACYDNSDGCLKYAYMSAYDQFADIKTATVDGYGITGTNINIDVVKENGSFVPYISYYMPSLQKVKMAHLIDASALTSTTEGALDGSDDDDFYTGVWECSLVPTESSIEEDNTSIGFWKYTDSTNTATFGTARAIKSNGTAAANTAAGVCNGNGTANPVVAYNIAVGAANKIEVAQMK